MTSATDTISDSSKTLSIKMTHLLSLASQKSKIIISNLNLITVINAEKFTILKTLKVELMEIYIQTFRKRQKSYYVFFEPDLCRVLTPIIWANTKFEQNGKI